MGRRKKQQRDNLSCEFEPEPETKHKQGGCTMGTSKCDTKLKCILDANMSPVSDKSDKAMCRNMPMRVYACSEAKRAHVVNKVLKVFLQFNLKTDEMVF